ncbi:MAG TPA: hypothetical protein VIF12_02890 [Micavibrio sp.]
MGTYIIREVAATIARFERMERRLTEIFRDLERKNLPPAIRMLDELVGDCRDDAFAIEPVLAALNSLSHAGGKPVAAKAAESAAQLANQSKAGLDGHIRHIQAEFEGRVLCRSVPPLEREDLQRLLENLRRRMVGIGTQNSCNKIADIYF